MIPAEFIKHQFLTLYQHLRVRKVFRIIAIYAGAAFATLSGGPDMTEKVLGVSLDVSSWQLIFRLLIAGFPLAILLSWYVNSEEQKEALGKLPPLRLRQKDFEDALRANATVGGGITLSHTLLVSALTIVLCAILFFGLKPVLPTIYQGQIDSWSVLYEYDADTYPNLDYLNEGLAETVTKNLLRLPYIQVAPWSIVSRELRRMHDALVVGRKLKSNKSLVISAMRHGEDFSIIARILDPVKANDLWEQTYHCKGVEAFGLIEELTRKIAEASDISIDVLDTLFLSRYNSRTTAAFSHYLRGLHYARKETRDDNQIAIEHLEKVLMEDSSFTVARAALADAQEFHYERGWDQNPSLLVQARENSLRVLAVDSLNAQALSVMGTLAYLEGDRTTALEMYLRAEEAEPQNTLTLVRLAALEMDDDPMKAIMYLTRITQIDPSDAVALCNLGIAYGQRKNYTEAVKALQKSTELDPSNPDGWQNLGYAYERLNEYGRALDSYKMAVETGPTLPAMYIGLATLMQSQGEYSKVENLLLQGLRKNPDDDELQYVLGITYQLSGAKTNAKTAFEEGYSKLKKNLVKNQNRSELFVRSGLFNARLGRNTTALSDAHQALVLDSLNSETLIGMARIHAILGNEEQMLRFYRRAAQMNVEYDAAYLATALDFEKYRKDPRLLAIAKGEPSRLPEQ